MVSALELQAIYLADQSSEKPTKIKKIQYNQEAENKLRKWVLELDKDAALRDEGEWPLCEVSYGGVICDDYSENSFP